MQFTVILIFHWGNKAATKKSPPHCEGLLSESLSYFFFLAAFFLGAAFFLAAFFLVAMCLEFKWLEINNDSKNRIII
jgi:hypothetical protein